MDAKNSSIFPTKSHAAIFGIYVLLFVNQGLLVTASRNGKKSYPYNTALVVLSTETLKLFISFIVYIKKHSLLQFYKDLLNHGKLLAFYFIPAALYTIYNNLAYLNLSHFDPAPYFILLQIRLVLTGVIYQILFQKKLSTKQWMSLILLTIACMVQNFDFSTTWKMPNSFQDLCTGIVLILIQASCSVIGGVYSEYIIKHKGMKVDLMLQNVFMYLNSIACNAILLGATIENVSFTNAYQSLTQVYVIIIIINNSMAGLITSLFLKKLNSIVKAFASALEIILTAILSYIFLKIPLYANTVIAVGIVSYAVVMYARNPMLLETKTDRKISETA